MLSQCANPNCNKPLHYLRDGKVFLFSRKSSSKQDSNLYQLMEHYWLCGECAENWTITLDGDQGVQLVERKRRRFQNTYRRRPALATH